MSLASGLRRPSLAVPLVVCAGLNVAILVAIWARHPDYLLDYRTNPSVDAPPYVLLGRNIFLHGAYSRNPEAPFVPDLFRTPGYPVFAGGLDLIGGAGLIYAVQILLHLALCVVVYALANRAFGERAAFLSALFAAIHPTLLVLNVQAMSEMVFLFLLMLSVLLVTRVMAPLSTAPRGQSFAAGVLLGSAILVRPAGLYLPLLVAVVLGVVVARIQGLARAARLSAVFLLGVTLCVAPWIARNYVVFGTPTLTTNDTVVLIYFTGAGAYQIHHGVDRDTASAMIAREYGIHPPEDMWNYQGKGYSPVEMDEQARRVIVPVLTRYPAELVMSCGLGLVKAFFSHDAGMWAKILELPRWTAPGTGGLFGLDREAWDRLLGNHPLLIVVFLAQLLINGTLVVLLLCGVALALRRARAPVYLLFLLLGFFGLVCAASGLDAYTRFSAPILPFAFVFAGLAGSKLYRARTSQDVTEPLGAALPKASQGSELGIEETKLMTAS